MPTILPGTLILYSLQPPSHFLLIDLTSKDILKTHNTTIGNSLISPFKQHLKLLIVKQIIYQVPTRRTLIILIMQNNQWLLIISIIFSIVMWCNTLIKILLIQNTTPLLHPILWTMHSHLRIIIKISRNLESYTKVIKHTREEMMW